MSSCYSLNLELIKTFSPSNSSSSSRSPSESRTSPRSILTRKARAPRKRPNQTYNEAASILSEAYPKIFPLPLKFTKSTDNRSPPFLSPPDDLLQGPLKKTESRLFNSFEKACEADSRVYYNNCTELYDDDFSAESMLDEEIEEGIDSIMGYELMKGAITCNSVQMNMCCNAYPVALGYGLRRELTAIRHVDEGDWWRFPCVNVPEKKKDRSAAIPLPNAGLRLKLDYDDVLKAWSGKGSPFSGDAPAAGNDVQVRLVQTDSFPEKGGAEGGAVVLPYKEKRCTRLSSKKPKYQIKKVNADQRPRSKGRFVKTSNPIDDDYKRIHLQPFIDALFVV